MRAAAALMALALAPAAAGQPAPAPTAAPKTVARPDFSGTWKLDEAASVNVSSNMKGAVLSVEQSGDKIRVTPLKQGPGNLRLSGDQIVADGRPYEKGVGGGKGVLTARWSADGKALELELTGTASESGRTALQTSRWSLSEDRATWTRETRTSGGGQSRTSRLVFRRQKPAAPALKKTPAKK